MRVALATAVFLIGTFASIAMGELLDATAGGFSLAHETIVDASRAEVWDAAVTGIGQWWDDDHTISGDAAALRIDAVPQGCFCEALGEAGGIVHLTVTFVNPRIMLRMTGGLGPLGLLGVNGNMLWEFFDTDDGTRVRISYAVGGYHSQGLDSIAGSVDAVIGEALQRLKAFAETGDASAGNVD
ncbi:MAG: SRPBCC domain-containing protein [Gammaproteobacteria bacterium]|nr:SRPBCC domain-containing protein [Gammaproteobacteria bacterium]